MGTSSVNLQRAYTSFSGTDIRVVIGGKTLGNCQAVSYAIQREKAPIYVMGHVDALSFARGKRGIAGTVVALMFDRHMLFHRPLWDSKAVVDKDEIYPSVNFLNDASTTTDLNAVGQGQDPLNPTFDESDIGNNYQLNQAWYLDQVPPVDLVIIAANESGKAATMRIYGMEFLNEGSGFSVDDMVIEQQTTYICRTILPWQPLGEWDMSTGAFTKKTIQDIQNSGGGI